MPVSADADREDIKVPGDRLRARPLQDHLDRVAAQVGVVVRPYPN